MNPNLHFYDINYRPLDHDAHYEASAPNAVFKIVTRLNEHNTIVHDVFQTANYQGKTFWYLLDSIRDREVAERFIENEKAKDRIIAEFKPETTYYY